MEINTKQCLYCQKTLRGRADKKFCTDYCRNAYNNKQNSDANNFVRNVNNILRKNRRILESFLPTNTDKLKVQKDKLLQAGFNFSFHTQQYVTQAGKIYMFNYEYGYLIIDNDWLLIVKRERQS